jgi:exonuclease SbcC
MSAFGPYAAEQPLDFRQLGDKRFFLIHGPTGGGKTTILDAMCYALYGDTSGKERDGEQMRSQLASAERSTFVTFDFSIGDKQYRVRRSPRQERPKKYTEGTTIEQPAATLWDRTGVGDNGEGIPLATKSSTVTEQVEVLLGFKSEQFRQVIMLPQGKFRELLLADSGKREGILQTLFQTSFYEKVQEVLKEQAKEVATEREIVSRRRKFVLEQATVASRDELTTRRDETRTTAQGVEDRLKLLREADSEAQATLASQRKTQEAFDEHRKALGALTQIELNQADANKKRAQIEAAERAQKVTAAELAMRQRQNESKERQAALESAAENERRAMEALAALQTQMQIAEARRDERETLSTEVVRLNSLRSKVNKLEMATSESAKADLSRNNLFTKVEDATSLHARTQQSAEEARKQHATALGLEAGLDGHRLAVQNSKKQLEDRKRLQSSEAAVLAKARLLHVATAELERANGAMLSQKAALADVQKAWIEGQAARLAQRLEDRKACPVCGSIEHPFPATATGAVPSDDALTAAQAAVDQESAVSKRAEQALQTVQHEIAAERRTADACRTSLGDAVGETIESIQMRLKEQAAAMARSEAARNSLPTLQSNIEGTSASAVAAKESQSDIEKHYRDAVVVAVAAQTTLSECREGISETCKTIAALDAEVGRLSRLIQGIDLAVRTAREATEHAGRTRSASSEAYQAAQREKAGADERLSLAKSEFARKLGEQGFASETDLNAAKLVDVQVRLLQEEVEAHTRMRIAACDRESRAQQGVKGLVAPDLAATLAVADAARQSVDAGIAQMSSLNRDLSQIDKWFQDLDAAQIELDRLDAQYAVIGHLADVADGKNGARLKFSRFVLGFLLDDVLIAATHRLKIISQGRYELHRRKESADMRTYGGLELEVFDANTGYARPAETLSGGESFLASLSLALGLADVVQARAGGIRMETMFIDEGFGGLDSETLDGTISALMNVFKDGRLVGIISHVAELRERIDARLEVRHTQRGSSASFEVN